MSIPKRKKQVKVGQKKKTSFDMKLRPAGRKGLTRYLPVGKILPKDWMYVRVHKPEIKGRTATVKMECLLKTTEVKE